MQRRAAEAQELPGRADVVASHVGAAQPAVAAVGEIRVQLPTEQAQDAPTLSAGIGALDDQDRLAPVTRAGQQQLQSAEQPHPPADALLVIGEGSKAATLAEAFAICGKPVLAARLVPDCDTRWLSVLPVIAFAGIGRPEKAFATIRNSGARVIATHAFGDHHRYTEREARKLLDEAEAKKAMLVTTAKDWERLPDVPGTALGELKHRSRPLPVVLKLHDESAITELLKARKLLGS